MTDHSINLLEYLRKLALESDADFLRESLKVVTQLLMEAEVAQAVGAQKYERSEERTNQRNGYRERRWETRVGNILLKIPKLRRGSYFPEWLLEPRRLSEQAVLNVIQEAYIQGVSTRKVEAVVQQLGLEKLDKSKVSRITQGLQAEVESFRNRPLPEKCVYVFLDAIYPKVRLNHRVVSVALVIAIGIQEDGRRVILGFEVGAAETEAFWSEFLRSLVARGLSGVQLVISDAHEGLRQALAKVFHGAAWQRCRVHFMRNLLAHVPQKDKKQVAAWVRTIFAQPDLQAAQLQLNKVKAELEDNWPRTAELLQAAADDILAFMNFPEEHWKRLASNNLLERLNREIRRRTDVVQVFPDENALLRLVGTLLIEVDTEWAVGRRYFSEGSMRKLFKEPPEKNT